MNDALDQYVVMIRPEDLGYGQASGSGDDAQRPCAVNRVGSVVHIEFAVRALGAALGRSAGDPELVGDEREGQCGGQVPQDPDLGRCDRRRPGRVGLLRIRRRHRVSAENRVTSCDL